MEVTLLSMETPVLEIRADSDILSITNKRLIHNSKFIGLQELRGATVSATTVTVGGSDVQGYEVTKSKTILFLTIMFCICGYVVMRPYDFPGYFAVFAISLIGAVIFGSLLAAPVQLFLNAKRSIASKTVDMAWLAVEKTDNTYFINQYYSLGQLEQLKRFESEINNLIFK